MFDPNMSNKYPSAATKDLGMAPNYCLCSADNFFIMHPSFVVKTYHIIDILYIFDACMKAPKKTAAVTYIPKNCLQIP